ncbi:hypothetical protein TURU_020051 [Turdus rufiventris]|nr:hypothetical protein TURU_020051 [Turdus rufiventris]
MLGCAHSNRRCLLLLRPLVEHWWSSSPVAVQQQCSSICSICSWAGPDQTPSGLSTTSGLLHSHPQSPRQLPGIPTALRDCPRHINVGSDFQAELPELQTRPPSDDEEHASLVWKPWEDDDSDMDKPDRVRQLLDMASSRGFPRAAANLELALHCLHQARGSVPEALEMLLSGGPPTPQGHPLADYHYADSDRWTPEEKESFEKALHTYGKNFHLIQKQIQSKTVAQCVEYYYSWKKGQKLARTLAQVSGKKIKIRREGHETGRRGENLLDFNASLVMRGPKLNTGFEVWPHQYEVKGDNPCPVPAGHTIADAAQDAIGLLGHLGTPWLMFSCWHQHPQVMEIRRGAGDWKKANVTLVLKRGKKENQGNYQPVSLTSIPGKVTEHLILETISIHMDDKKGIRSRQCGEITLAQPDHLLQAGKHLD